MSRHRGVYEEARKELLNGHSDYAGYYTHFMDDPDGVVDSVITSIEDNVGTPGRRSTPALYNKYARIADGDPVIGDTRKYGHALKILDVLRLMEHHVDQSRWEFLDPDTEALEQVRRASHHPEVRRQYDTS